MLKDLRGEEVKDGDTVEFLMPGFCSGDYVYQAKQITKIVFPEAPPGILQACSGFQIIKKQENERGKI